MLTDEELLSPLPVMGDGAQPVTESTDDELLTPLPGTQQAPTPQVEAAPTEERINVYDPQGKLVSAPATDIRELVERHGYELPEARAQRLEADEYGDFGSQVAAGVEGLAQGFTAGFYGLAADAIAGDDYTRGRELRKELSPITSGITEGLGLVGSTVLMPVGNVARGAAWATRAATQTGAKAVATRLATEAVAGVVEAGAFSAASRTAEGLTGDNEFDAEAILLGAGKDALLGGAVGAGLKVVGEGIGAAGGRLAEMGEEGAIESLSNNLAWKAVSSGNKRAQEQAARFHGGGDKVGKFILDKDLLPVTGNIDEFTEKVGTLKEQVGRSIEEHVTQLDALGVRPDGRIIADRIRSEVVDPLLNDPVTQKVGQRLLNDLKPMLKQLDRSAGSTQGPSGFYDSFNSLWKSRQGLDKKAKWTSRAPSELTESIQDARRVFEDSFIDMADDVVAKATDVPMDVGQWAASYKAAKDDYRTLSFLSEVGDNKAAQNGANRSVSLTDTIMGAAGGIVGSQLGSLVNEELGGGFLGGVGGTLAVGGFNKFGRSMLPAIGARGLRGIGSVVQRGQGAVSIASKNIVAVLERGSTLVDSKNPEGDEGAELLDDAVVDKALARARQITSGTGEASVDLQSSTDAVTTLYGPQLGAAIAGAMRARSTFLQAKYDELVPRRGDVFAAARPPQVSGVARRKLARYVAAVEDPMKAVRRIGAFQGTREDVEVLRTLYPRTYDNLQRRVVAELKMMKAVPNRALVARLSRDLGIPLRWSQTPEVVAFLSGLSSKAAQDEGGGGGGGPRRSSRKSDLAERTQSGAASIGSALREG